MHRVQNVRSSTFEMKLLNSQNSHVGHSNLIHGLTQIFFIRDVELN